MTQMRKQKNFRNKIYLAESYAVGVFQNNFTRQKSQQIKCNVIKKKTKDKIELISKSKK